MIMIKRVAILTGGGDVPGLNMCLKSLVYRVIDLGFEPIGIRKGWEGFINYNPHDPTTYSEHFIELTKNMVRPIDRTPGSFLHSSRSDPRQIPADKVPEFLREKQVTSQDLTGHIEDVIHRLGYQALIVIGDDDTLHYAAYLSQKNIPIIAIPKTIHNNIHGTDYTLGFSTGLARGVAFIHDLRALAGSREQVVVVETFAAKSGYSTLIMGFLSGADRVLIPEVAFDPDQLASLVQQDKRETPANYSVVLVCDGAQLAPNKSVQYAPWLHRSRHNSGVTPRRPAPARLTDPEGVGRSLDDSLGVSGEYSGFSSGIVVTHLLSHISGEEVLHQPLTYLLRTGSPDGQDLLGAANFAMTAARLLYEGSYGRMAAFVQEKMWTHVDINLALEGVKTVDVEAWYDVEKYKPNLSIIWAVNEK
jgi:6-phosphofructokinase 1